MSPQRIVQGTRVWVELPDGFGRHLVTITQLDSITNPPLAELQLMVTFAPPDEQPAGLEDFGRLEPGRVIEAEGLLGRWEIIQADADLSWQPMFTLTGDVAGSERVHDVRLRLRPEGARY